MSLFRETNNIQCKNTELCFTSKCFNYIKIWVICYFRDTFTNKQYIIIYILKNNSDCINHAVRNVAGIIVIGLLSIILNYRNYYNRRGRRSTSKNTQNLYNASLSVYRIVVNTPLHSLSN